MTVLTGPILAANIHYAGNTNNYYPTHFIWDDKASAIPTSTIRVILKPRAVSRILYKLVNAKAACTAESAKASNYETLTVNVGAQTEFYKLLWRKASR